MQELIAPFLFQHKTCPLPGIGILFIMENPASFVQSEKILSPPLPKITFSAGDTTDNRLIKYIAVEQGITEKEAAEEVQNFCSAISNLDAYAEMEIPFAGKFYVNAEGNLVFKQVNNPDFFLPPVPAERVTHPETTHAILVGDTESNSALMTEFYNETIPAKKSKWWIGALVLAVLGIMVIIFYYSNGYTISNAGNIQKVTSGNAAKSYNTP